MSPIGRDDAHDFSTKSDGPLDDDTEGAVLVEEWQNTMVGNTNFIDKRQMPDGLGDKVIVTNTTTETGMALFRERGVRAVITTPPRIQGCYSGTNLLEAALTAAYGKAVHRGILNCRPPWLRSK